MEKMIWKNLKDCKCPKCAGTLEMGARPYYRCACGYVIGRATFEDLVKKMYAPRGAHRAGRDNFEALQNLDHKGITEDFSDSPHLNY